MEQIFNTFHIDWKLLIAQAINFAIVVAVLYKFAYKPLMKHMKERTNKIDQGLKDAENARKQLEKAQDEKEAEIVKAKKEARLILEGAQKQAEKNKGATVAEAKEEAEKVVQQAKKQIEGEKEKMLVEVRSEVGQLVVAATEKVVDEKIDDKKDRKLVEEAVRDISR